MLEEVKHGSEVTAGVEKYLSRMEEIIVISYIQKLIDKIKKSEKGQGMVEYALIIAFVAAIAIFVLNGKLGTSINEAFDKASTNVTSATDASDKIATTGSSTTTETPTP